MPERQVVIKNFVSQLVFRALLKLYETESRLGFTAILMNLGKTRVKSPQVAFTD